MICGSLATWPEMNFTATSVRRVRWSATQTQPMAPSPRGRVSRTLAVTMVPGDSSTWASC